MSDRGTWPKTRWATRCLPLHNSTTAAGSLKQEEIHPFPKDIPTCVGTLCFFPPTGPSLGRVWRLHYLFQNPGLNKSSSIGLVTLLFSAAGWWYSLPRIVVVLVRAAPGNRMPGEQFLLCCRSTGQGLRAFHCPDMPQHNRSEKSPSLGKQLIWLLPGKHFKGNYWEGRVILY